MFCPKCGNQIPDGAAFCGECGMPIGNGEASAQPQNTQEATVESKPSAQQPRKKHTKAIIAIASPIVLTLIAAAVVIAMNNTPTAKMNRAIKDGNITAAYEIYTDKLSGESLSEGTIDALKSYADSILADFEADKLSFEKAEENLESLYQFAAEESDLEEYLDEADDQLYSLHRYKNDLEKADSAYDKKDYEEAMRYYRSALSEYEDSEAAAEGFTKAKSACVKEILAYVDEYLSDHVVFYYSYDTVRDRLNTALSNTYLSDNEELKNKLDEVTDLWAGSAIEEADSEIENGGDYDRAISILGKVLQERPDNSAVQEKYDSIIGPWVDTVLKEADALLTDGSYDAVENAKKILEDALNKVPDNEKLNEKYFSIEDPSIYEEIIAPARNYADGGDWVKAKEHLEIGMQYYPDSAAIKSAYEDLKKKMPSTLSTVTRISSSDGYYIHDKSGVVKDRYGNIYDGGVGIGCYWNDEMFVLLNLDGVFTTFNATIFASTDCDNGRKFAVSIYLDNTLAWYQDGITEETAPFDISLDVTGKKTMKVVVKDEAPNTSKHELWFGATEFVRVEDDAAAE